MKLNQHQHLDHGKPFMTVCFASRETTSWWVKVDTAISCPSLMQATVDPHREASLALHLAHACSVSGGGYLTVFTVKSVLHDQMQRNLLKSGNRVKCHRFKPRNRMDYHLPRPTFVRTIRQWRNSLRQTSHPFYMQGADFFAYHVAYVTISVANPTLLPHLIPVIFR